MSTANHYFLLIYIQISQTFIHSLCYQLILLCLGTVWCCSFYANKFLSNKQKSWLYLRQIQNQTLYITTVDSTQRVYTSAPSDCWQRVVVLKALASAFVNISLKRITFACDSVPDTDSWPLFHFPQHHCRIGRLDLLAFFVLSPAALLFTKSSSYPVLVFMVLRLSRTPG